MNKIIAIMFIAVILVFGIIAFAQNQDVNDKSSVVVEEDAVTTTTTDADNNNKDKSDPTIVESEVDTIEDADGNVVYEEDETIVFE